MSHEIAGLVDPRLRFRSPTETQTRSDLDMAQKLRDVLEAWTSSRTTPGMSQALAETACGSARETVDALLATDQGLFTYLFRLDAQGPVVSFSVKET